MPRVLYSSRFTLLITGCLLMTGWAFFCCPPVCAQLDPATLKRVKDSTVYLQVKLPNGKTSQGSGFLAVGPGLVLTNAHVLGMLEPDSPAPQKIDVVVRSGEADSRTLTGQLLGVDGTSDLAILRIAGKDLPPPLPLASAKDLMETQEVFIFGFPFGKNLGANITVSKSSVSSLRKQKGGAITRVQVNGGMHPGNSGGPVTDASGKVIGVAVSVIQGTQIHFAIPADSVQAFVSGRIINYTAHLIYRDGDNIKQPIELKVMDPLAKISKIEMDYWLDERKPTKTKGKEPGRKTMALTYDQKKGLAKGEIVMAAPANPKLHLWFRPAYYTLGKIHRVSSIPLPIKPLERKALTLAYKPVLGSTRTLDLQSQTRFKIRDDKGQEHSMGMNLGSELKIKTQSAPGGYRLEVSYEKLDMKVLVDNQPLRADELRMAQDDIKLAKANMQLDKGGNIRTASIDLKAAPAGSRIVLEDVTNQVLDALEAMAVRLPGKVEPLETWKDKRRLTIGTPWLAVPVQADLEYSYMGFRQFLENAKPEATINVKGKLVSPPKSKLQVTGEVTGTILVGLETGEVVSTALNLRVDMELPVKGRPAQASGTLSVQLQRKIVR